MHDCLCLLKPSKDGAPLKPDEHHFAALMGPRLYGRSENFRAERKTREKAVEIKIRMANRSIYSAGNEKSRLPVRLQLGEGALAFCTPRPVTYAGGSTVMWKENNIELYRSACQCRQNRLTIKLAKRNNAQ